MRILRCRQPQGGQTPSGYLAAMSAFFEFWLKGKSLSMGALTVTLMKLWNTNKSEQHIDVHTCVCIYIYIIYIYIYVDITILSWILLFWFKRTTRSLNFSHGHSARSRLHEPYQAHGMQTFEKAVLILWGWIGNLKDYDFHYLPSDWLKGPPWTIGIPMVVRSFLVLVCHQRWVFFKGRNYQVKPLRMMAL